MKKKFGFSETSNVSLIRIAAGALLLCFITVISFAGVYSSTVPSVVFVSRNMTTGGSIHFPQMTLIPGSGPFSRTAVVGGSLLLRESNGNVITLTDSSINHNGIRLVDVSDPCVHWNGSKILFSGIEHRDSSWRIYEINTDGTSFRKVTYSNRNIELSQFGSAAFKFLKYDDFDPCYLPDDRICFSSTRYPSLSFYGTRTANLYVINSDGSGFRRITTERNSAEEPTIDPITGKIVYSRWWVNIDMPSRLTPQGITRDTSLAMTTDIGNIWWSARINPDGSEMQLYGGSFISRLGLQTYKPVVMDDSRLLSVFNSQTQLLTNSGSSGFRIFNRGPGEQKHIAGVNMETMQTYNNFPDSWGIMQPPYALDPIPAPGGKIIFSYANSVENADFGLYLINMDGTGLEPFFNITGKLELNPEIVLAKQLPPLIPDNVLDISDELPPTSNPDTYFKNGALRFDCSNIFTNGDVDMPIADAPPLTKNARIKLYLNFQRTDTSGKDDAILFLNEPIQFAGGFWIPMIPADVPVFDQVVDFQGRVIAGSKGQIAHLSGLNFGRPGTGTQCVGCHQGHSFIPMPTNNYDGQFFNTSTSASVTESSFRIINNQEIYSGKKVVDRKARNDSLSVNWIAAGAQNEWVKLNWEVNIDARKFVLYNIRPNTQTGTDIQVNDCEIFTYLNGVQVWHTASTGPISTNGTVVLLDTPRSINEAKIIVKSFSGNITGQSVPGLAEVETIARMSYYDLTDFKHSSGQLDNFNLSQNYPNPFNPSTKIKFTVPNDRDGVVKIVKLSVYNILGKTVEVIIDKNLQPGSYEVVFNAGNNPAGVYLYNLTIGNSSETKKMLLIK